MANFILLLETGSEADSDNVGRISYGFAPIKMEAYNYDPLFETLLTNLPLMIVIGYLLSLQNAVNRLQTEKVYYPISIKPYIYLHFYDHFYDPVL